MSRVTVIISCLADLTEVPGMPLPRCLVSVISGCGTVKSKDVLTGGLSSTSHDFRTEDSSSHVRLSGPPDWLHASQ